MEAAPIVQEDDLRPLEVKNHLGSVIAIHVFETERDWHQVSVGPVELWTKVDASMRWVPAWQLDHFQTTVEIQGDEMTGHARRFVVPDRGVDLKRARTPVVEVIERRADPGTDDDDHGQDRHRDHHAHAEIEQRME